MEAIELGRGKKARAAQAAEPRYDRGTPETQAKLRKERPRDYLVRLEDDPVFERACNEIERTFLALTRALFPRPASMETRAGMIGLGTAVQAGRNSDLPEAAAMAYALRWKPWADVLSRLRDSRGIPALAVVLDVLVDERSFRYLDDAYSMRRGTARLLAQESIRFYCVTAEWKRADEYGRFEILD